jgi:hypothetical protein
MMIDNHPFIPEFFVHHRKACGNLFFAILGFIFECIFP